jgi:SAM-dependent methyltransferase
LSSYSPSWYRVFGGPVPFERTEVEVAFLARVLPLPGFRRVLDVPCGHGRHAARLAELGYDVTGVELDPAAAANARAAAPGASIVEGDMRALPVRDEHDAVVCMWASFGFWDDATNACVLGRMASVLRRPGGRLVLDVFDRRFFEPRQGERERDVEGVLVRERHRIEDDRLHVELEYGDSDDRDAFQWRLYDPPELAALLPGARTAVLCHDWDEAAPPDGTRPRYQLVLERG